MKQRLINYMRASFPALAIRTAEEARCMEVILAAVKDLGRNVFAWTAASGLRQLHEGNKWAGYRLAGDGQIEGADMPGEAAKLTVAAMTEEGKPDYGVLVFCDLHSWMGSLDPITERNIKDLLRVAPTRGATIIFLSPEFRPPASWEKSVTVLDFELPTRAELDAILTTTESNVAKSGGKFQALANGEREDMLRAASGLTAPEAENAFSLAVIEGWAEKRLNAKTVYREKAAAVKRSGLMEIAEPDPRGLDAIGGLDNLKAWIMQRKAAYSNKAREYGLPSPKGVVLAGVPGSGKTLAARCVGTVLNVPTIRLDIGALFAGIVGESEARTRAALALAEAVAPCVLFCDELEKGLAGSRGGGELDSGVGRRVLGTILSWLQDHKKDVFLFATANQVWQLPPELLRAGRVDALFYLSLPKDKERREIFKIHLEKRGRNVKKFDLDELAAASLDFTGSECEAAVVSAMYAAFDEGKEITTKYVVAACKATVPLARTMPDDIHKLEEWGAKHARPASSETITKGDQFRRLVGGE